MIGRVFQRRNPVNSVNILAKHLLNPLTKNGFETGGLHGSDQSSANVKNQYGRQWVGARSAMNMVWAEA